jgi:DNA topoisomerase I
MSVKRTSGTALDSPRSARAAGLRYVCDGTTRGVRRLGKPGHFRYIDASGRRITDKQVVQRIYALAIPPAWTDVWICPDPDGHLQATGRDARRRKQYRYHPRWRVVRDDVKYGRLVSFAASLPKIRARTRGDLAKAGLPREKVLATVVQLLERTLIRVGNEEYARQNGSIGLTTMRDAHAKVNGATVRFEFRGKSGIRHAVDLNDRRLAAIVKACRDLPGYELFQYVDDDGTRQAIDSSDVNAYLREICGDDFTAKDFRTWSGTVLAARALAGAAGFANQREARRKVVNAIESVARSLGNTKTVCRKSYVHPAVIDAFLGGMTIRVGKVRPLRAVVTTGLSAEERAVVALVSARLRRKTA